MSESTLKSYVIDIFESITDYEYVELTDEEFEDIAKYIKENATEGDIVLTMGAGNVCDIGNLIVE